MNIQEAYRTPNRPDQKRNSSQHIIFRITNVLNKDKILNIPDFSPETMKVRRSWTDVIQTLREHKCQPRLIFPAKLSISIDEETKVSHGKIKFTHYLSMNPALQRIIRGKKKYKDGNHVLEKARR